MKTRTMKILLTIQSLVIILLLIWIFFEVKNSNNKTELLREISPDEDYVLLIEELGKPTFFLFSINRIKVTLHENNSNKHYVATFRVDVLTQKGTIHYAIEWLEDGVQIILSGAESYYYILPFKTLEDSRTLL